MDRFRARIIALACFAGLSTIWNSAHAAQSGTWTPLNNSPPVSASAPLLLTDGTVIVHEAPCGSRWFRLTPDNTGSYVNGTWSQIASLPAGYQPLYFASQVLPDARVIINGGEYNGSSCTRQDTTLGAIYDPVADAWTSVAPPSGWTSIGDAPSIVLGNGQYMLGNDLTKQQAILNPATLVWTATGSNKADVNNEEGWSLLPDGSVLTVDTNNAADSTHAEKYLPSTGGWISAGSTIVQLPAFNGTTCPPPGFLSCEIGPEILLPNGTVFATGATGNTSIYKPSPPGNPKMPGAWTPGPSFPSPYVADDVPAALLPDGNVLVLAGAPNTNNIQFFEYDGTLTAVANPANPVRVDLHNMLVLPTGQVLLATYSTDVEIYSPAGTFREPWRPTIEQGPFTLVHGQTYQVFGRLFNGRSLASAYGDDYQGATNYPLVRITNLATGHVFYCRTFNTDSVTPTNDGRVSTNFAVPSDIELGDSQVEVVTNGIPSRAKAASVM